MGARENFEKAVRNGDFAAAARAWLEEPLEQTPGVEAFESKLQASLEDREVTIGETLKIASGEYEYLGNAGEDGARMAYIPADASLDRMEFIRDAEQLVEHLQRIQAPTPEQDAVVAFFAMSERAIRTIEPVAAQDLAAPIQNEKTPMELMDSLRILSAKKADDEHVIADALRAAQEIIINDRAHAGTLLAHGHAPYMHNVENAENYFVTLKSPDGQEETIWGKELASAITDAKVEPGVDILLAHQGSKQVTVPVKELDGMGKPTGKMVNASATRNSWAIRSVDDLVTVVSKEQTHGAAVVVENPPTEDASVELPAAETISEAPVAEAIAVEHGDSIENESEAVAEAEHDDAIQPASAGRRGLVSDAIAHARLNAEDAILRASSKGSGGVQQNIGGAADIAHGPKTLLNGRFILRDRGEYFRVADGVTSTRVALVDEVNKIRFVDKQMDTFQAALELAKHKQWEAILVTGSEKFRAEAWHHARMQGLEVVGYEPTEKDLATLAAAQGKGPHTSTLNDSRTDEEKAVAASLADINERIVKDGFGARPAQTENGRHVGKVLFESDKHFAQDTGRKVATVHSKENFDSAALQAAVEKGGVLKVQYKGGRGVIEAEKDRSQARGR